MFVWGFWCPYWDPFADVFRTCWVLFPGCVLAWFWAPCFVDFSWIMGSFLVTFVCFFVTLVFCDFNDPSAAIASVLRVGGGRC